MSDLIGQLLVEVVALKIWKTTHFIECNNGTID